MAGTNDFKAFAAGGGANVITQAAYTALTTLISNGFQTGLAQSAQLNKVWRQSTIMAQVVGDLIANVSGQNVVDDGTTATILSNLTASLLLQGYKDDTGVVNAYVVTLPISPAAYYDGMMIAFSTTTANTTTTPTVNVNTLGAITLTLPGGGALNAGHIQANTVVVARYNSTGPRFEVRGLYALNTTNTFNKPQRSAAQTANTASFDLSLNNNFSCTPTGAVALTFTNLPAAGVTQTGDILFINNSNYAVTAAAGTKVPSSLLATISATGRYWLSYKSQDGSSVDVVGSAALA